LHPSPMWEVVEGGACSRCRSSTTKRLPTSPPPLPQPPVAQTAPIPPVPPSSQCPPSPMQWPMQPRQPPLPPVGGGVHCPPVPPRTTTPPFSHQRHPSPPPPFSTPHTLLLQCLGWVVVVAGRLHHSPLPPQWKCSPLLLHPLHPPLQLPPQALLRPPWIYRGTGLRPPATWLRVHLKCTFTTWPQSK